MTSYYGETDPRMIFVKSEGVEFEWTGLNMMGGVFQSER